MGSINLRIDDELKARSYAALEKKLPLLLCVDTISFQQSVFNNRLATIEKTTANPQGSPLLFLPKKAGRR